MTNKQLIKNLKLDWVNSDITEENFPIDKNPQKCEIIYYNEVLTTDEVLKRLDDDGYRPATLTEMLLWDEDWKEEFVAALGSVWQGPGGYRRCPCLFRDGSERFLSLYWIDGRWYGRCRFASVRKYLGTSETKISKTLEPLEFCECKKCPQCGLIIKNDH